jgi:hypothetical protein
MNTRSLTSERKDKLERKGGKAMMHVKRNRSQPEMSSQWLKLGRSEPK